MTSSCWMGFGNDAGFVDQGWIAARQRPIEAA
jgi:hypothetical protein